MKIKIKINSYWHEWICRLKPLRFFLTSAGHPIIKVMRSCKSERAEDHIDTVFLDLAIDYIPINFLKRTFIIVHCVLCWKSLYSGGRWC